MFNCPDHPDIIMAEATGYGRFNQPTQIYCGECGRDITDGEQYEDEHFEYLCRHCLLMLHEK